MRDARIGENARVTRRRRHQWIVGETRELTVRLGHVGRGAKGSGWEGWKGGKRRKRARGHESGEEGDAARRKCARARAHRTHWIARRDLQEQSTLSTFCTSPVIRWRSRHSSMTYRGKRTVFYSFSFPSDIPTSPTTPNAPTHCGIWHLQLRLFTAENVSVAPSRDHLRKLHIYNLSINYPYIYHG